MAALNAQLGAVYFGEPCEVIVYYGKLVSSTNALSFEASLLGEEQTHTWQIGSGEIVLKEKGDTSAQYVWTPPARLAQYIPNKSSAGLVFTVTETRYNSLGQPYPTNSSSTAVTAYVPQNLAPTVTMEIEAISDSAKIAEWGIFVKGMSRIKYTIHAEGQYGAAIKSYQFAAGGHTLRESTGTTPVLTTAGFPTATVVDSRSKTSVVQEAVDIYDYSKPTMRDTVVYRCNADGTPNESGTYMRVQCSAVCSSLGGRNSVSVRYRRREVGKSYGSYATLQNGVEKQVATNLDPNVVYEVELSAVDTVGSVTAVSFIGDNGRIAMHMRDGGDGVAFGKKCTEAGFACAWDAEFDGNLSVAKTFTVGGKSIVDIIYPVGSIYITASATSPAVLFGGTWTQIKDRFLLAAGSTYKAEATGGAATHKITTEEMPSHSHDVSGYTDSENVGHSHSIPNIQSGSSGEYGAYAETWGYGSGSRNLNTDFIDITHNHYVDLTSDFTGGNTAMSIMPPYLVVYVWKRTK